VTTVIAFPDDLILSALELNDHDDGSYSTNHDNEWPQEVNYTYPDVRSIRQSEHAYDRSSNNSDADTSVDLPLWIIEEEILTAHEQEKSTGKTVSSDHYSPSDGATSKRQHEQAIVTPHSVL